MVKMGRKTYALSVIIVKWLLQDTQYRTVEIYYSIQEFNLASLYEYMGTCNDEAEESFAKAFTSYWEQKIVT